MTDEHEAKARAKELWNELSDKAFLNQDLNIIERHIAQALRDAAKVEWPSDLIKELIDNCEASTAETDISDERKAYRKDLLARAQWLRSKVEGKDDGNE